MSISVGTEESPLTSSEAADSTRALPTTGAMAAKVGRTLAAESSGAPAPGRWALSLWAVLVPQGLAYGELAGLAPVTGLYTALGAMVAYALLGTSRYLNLGPESSVAILVASSLAPLAGGDPDRYAALAGLLAIMVGGLLLAGYPARLGVVTRLLSAPVLTGYLAGSAIVIIVGQLTKVTGIDPGEADDPTVIGVARNLSDLDPWALAVAVGTALVVLVVLRLAPRAPAPLIGLALAITCPPSTSSGTSGMRETPRWPYLLPESLTVSAAASPSGTLAAVLVAVGLAAVIVLPGFILLYVLDQRGLLPEEGVNDAGDRPLDRPPGAHTPPGSPAWDAPKRR